LKILVSGSEGFVGSHLIDIIEKESNSHEFIATSRSKAQSEDLYFDILDSCNITEKVQGVDVIIHLAAIAHTNIVSDEDIVNTNFNATVELANQAGACGISRFIFLSTINVNIDSDDFNAFTYAKKKAERELWKISKMHGFELVIIRTPLVYGPGVKANFKSLLNIVSKGIPLPFACINKNRRSMISVYNLVDFILKTIDHPNAANEVLQISDDHDLSTAGMINKLNLAFGYRGRMLYVPIILFQLFGKMLNKNAAIDRLIGSLYVDIEKSKKLLSWSPLISVDEGFKRTVSAFLENKREND